MQKLDDKLTELTAEIQQSLEGAPPSFRTSVLAFVGDIGEKPDWRTQPELFSFWAAQCLSLSARDKMVVCPSCIACITLIFDVLRTWRLICCTLSVLLTRACSQ